jgi:gas vesicle protein
LIGSVVPGAGNVIGAVGGAIAGALVGRHTTNQIKEASFREAIEHFTHQREQARAQMDYAARASQADLTNFVAQRDAEIKRLVEKERGRFLGLCAAERVSSANDYRAVLHEFDLLLERLDADLVGGFTEFVASQKYNRLRAALFPSPGDVAVMLATRWLDERRATIRQAQKRLSGFRATPDGLQRSAQFLLDFFKNNRFEADDFLRHTERLVRSESRRLVCLEDDSRVTAARVRKTVQRAQQEINATIDAAFINLQKRFELILRPTNHALERARIEGRKLGRQVG